MQPDSVMKYNGQPYQEITRVQVTTSDGFIKHIAHVFQGEGGVGSPQALEEQAANIALICAAPDLLEALMEVYKWGQRSEHERQQSSPVLKDYLRQAAEAARAAIAKATGGEA